MSAAKTMTPDEVKALRALADAATPGPWRRVGAEAVEAPDGHSVGNEVYAPESGSTVADRAPYGRGKQRRAGLTDANAAFIAACRTAVPALCDEVERLAEENARLREACSAALDGWDRKLSAGDLARVRGLMQRALHVESDGVVLCSPASEAPRG